MLERMESSKLSELEGDVLRALTSDAIERLELTKA